MNSKNVLIVEDDIAIRDLLEETLKEETTYQVFVASNAIEAIDMIHRITPDLFLLDYRMPKMNGIEFIDKIRAHERYKYTPIVLMSADLSWKKDPRDVRYLCKPFGLDDFLQTVEQCLNHAIPVI